MVSYQTFTSIAFDVAKDKGASFDGIEDGGSFVSQLSALWNRDKDQIKQWTEDRTRQYLREKVEA